LSTNSSYWQAWTDGSCHPNPGPAGAAAVIEHRFSGEKLKTEIRSVPSPGAGYKGTTINRAELYGIYLALEFFVRYDDENRRYVIYTDSKWSQKSLIWDIWTDPKGYANSVKNMDLRVKIVKLIEKTIKERLQIKFIPRMSHEHARTADAEAKRQRVIAAKMIKDYQIGMKDNGT
jgi:ribonuclease HI